VRLTKNTWVLKDLNDGLIEGEYDPGVRVRGPEAAHGSAEQHAVVADNAVDAAQAADEVVVGRVVALPEGEDGRRAPRRWVQLVTTRTSCAVANRWLDLLEPLQLHVQRIVDQLERYQIVPLEEADLDRRRPTDGEIHSLGNVRAVRAEEGGQEREVKLRGCNLSQIIRQFQQEGILLPSCRWHMLKPDI
jgi:hypothetical protein